MTGQADGQFDVVVIGAGLVGLSTAMALLAAQPSLRVAVLEKEQAVGAHQSGHNSGVIHAGLYYKPGSLKATFCREGRQAMIEFAQAHQIPYRLAGKLVVATHAGELGRLAGLADRGRANGLAVRELGPDEIAEIEPGVRGVRALHIPESGVIDYRLVAAAYAKVVTGHGGAVRCGHGVRGLVRERAGWAVTTGAGSRDMMDSLRFPGLRRLARAYAGTGAREIWRDLMKPAFLADMRRYVPAIRASDVRFGPSGIRAQCLSRSGVLVDDFLIEESAGIIHVLNAPSPAATASIVIGRHIASRVAAHTGR